LIVLVWLSVPLQVTDWKDSRLQSDLCIVGDIPTYSRTVNHMYLLI